MSFPQGYFQRLRTESCIPTEGKNTLNIAFSDVGKKV